MLEIEYHDITDLKPYKNNARKHTEADVRTIEASIRDFGMNDPIGIWGNENIIVEGHGRVMACHNLGIKTVPCIRLDHLSDEQRRAYTLAHNKTAEMSDWDFDILDLEILDIFEYDMEDYGFELFDAEEEHLENAVETAERVAEIENLTKGMYAGDGKYDIPILKPVNDLPPIKEWIGFNYVLSDDEPNGKAVHFFIDDYQFERIWKQPEKYVEKLKQYVCVATPDFSPYGDMPQAMQIYNHYRKHWVGAYLQEHGVTVIPTIRCSTDERSLEWYLDGEPKDGTVIISAMWTHEEEAGEMFKKEYGGMVEHLHPRKIFVYGGPDDLKFEEDVTRIKTFSAKRYG